jgi:mannopine transport system substrate-binding protein
MRIGRRMVIGGAVAIAAGGSARADGKLEDTVVIRTTGGAFEKALTQFFFDPFTAATGTRVVPVATTYGDMIAKTAAMTAAGRVEWDIISPQFYELELLAPYLEDLGDCHGLPNVASDGIPGICGRYGVQYLTGGVVLAWNPTAFEGRRAPANWADFWNVKDFPGRRSLPSYGNPWNNTLLFALMADGVPADKLFPLDLDRAFRKLDEIKPAIDVWWKTGAQSVDMFRSDDVQIAPLWSGNAFAAKRNGASLEWTYNQAAADLGSWAILKGAPHPNAARAFINFYMANPQQHADFAGLMGYATTSSAGLSLLSPELKRELVSSPAMLAQMASIKGAWVEANRVATLERWNAWLAS